MRKFLGYVLAVVAVVAGASTLFFGYYGIRVIVHVVTYDGEGSLGRVSAWIAAGLFPVISLVSLAIAWTAWRAARNRLQG